jgi:hypothetical protein
LCCVYCKLCKCRSITKTRESAPKKMDGNLSSQKHNHFCAFNRAQHFPSNLYPCPNHNHQQRPMPTHSMTYVHPCPPELFKLRPCIQKSCNMYFPPTPSPGWIGQIKGRSLSLASARSAFWLVYSLHPRSLTSIWSWM